jgi:hypothetical protein
LAYRPGVGLAVGVAVEVLEAVDSLILGTTEVEEDVVAGLVDSVMELLEVTAMVEEIKLLVSTWGDVFLHCLKYVAAPEVEPGTRLSTALK